MKTIKQIKKRESIMIIMLMIAFMLLSGCSPQEVTPINVSDDKNKVVVYFFWGDGCPHCATQKPVLEELENKYSQLEVKMFETYSSPENARLFQRVAVAYDTTARGVPATFIGDKFWIGYADFMKEEMENQIKYCIENECENPADKINK